MKKEKKLIDQDRQDADYDKNKKVQKELDKTAKKLKKKEYLPRDFLRSRTAAFFTALAPSRIRHHQVPSIPWKAPLILAGKC